jgi:hypothetical protein
MDVTKTHYQFMRAMAVIAAPVLRLTGFRFSKAWRENVFINHVEANLMADGFDVPPMRFN